jgi:hypothetical protein
MSAVPITSPVPWTNSPVDSTAPNNIDSAVRTWLNQQGIQDLTQLTPENLQALMTFLQQHATVPGAPDLLAKLTELQTNWKASTTGQDKLSNAINTLKFQQQFVGLLANATTGQDGLDTAKNAIEGPLNALENLQKAILQGSMSIDKDSGRATEKAVTDMLAQLDALKNSGVDLKSLGLQGLYDNLTQALNEYHAAVAEAGGDPVKLDMAGSIFRKAVATVRKDYLVSTGLSATHGLVQKEQDVIEGEDVYQDYLNTPRDENWKPAAPGVTLRDFQNAYKEAERMYNDAKAHGDQDGMNYFRERMNIIRTGIEGLESGKENTLIVIVTMYVSLLNLDTVRLETLRVRALDSGNQKLADRISERIDTINQLIQEINKGQTRLLSGVENIMASVRA